jgi:hypothetical protein
MSAQLVTPQDASTSSAWLSLKPEPGMHDLEGWHGAGFEPRPLPVGAGDDRHHGAGQSGDVGLDQARGATKIILDPRAGNRSSFEFCHYPTLARRRRPRFNGAHVLGSKVRRANRAARWHRAIHVTRSDRALGQDRPEPSDEFAPSHLTPEEMPRPCRKPNTLRRTASEKGETIGFRRRDAISELGQNRKGPGFWRMSVLDIVRPTRHVRFVPILLQKSKIERP